MQKRLRNKGIYMITNEDHRVHIEIGKLTKINMYHKATKTKFEMFFFVDLGHHQLILSGNEGSRLGCGYQGEKYIYWEGKRS